MLLRYSVRNRQENTPACFLQQVILLTEPIFTTAPAASKIDAQYTEKSIIIIIITLS
jgi:hypothetical protein